MSIFLNIRRIFYLFPLICVSLSAQNTSINYGNSLPATDALGRCLPARGDTGPQKERYVGIFYWIWHDYNINCIPTIPSEIVSKCPEAAYDYKNKAWPATSSYSWGEPLWGFYKDTDKWVLSRNAQMLADAGVDVIFFDVTNGTETFDRQWEVLCETYLELRSRGLDTPKISFFLPFYPTEFSRISTMNLYRKLFKPGRYSELFFYWEGKPLVLGYPECLDLPDENGVVPQIQKEAREFFTFRPIQIHYNVGPEREDHWGWLEISPQHGFGKTVDGRPEQMTVGIAQNWAYGNLRAMNTPGAQGRSYTLKNGYSSNPDDINYGLNFQEQWDNALAADPQFILITGWNEWIMGRAPELFGQVNAFTDQYDQEHSRDIEPMKGGHGDNYYYQMVANIRRFKGMPEEQEHYTKTRIAVDGNFEDWNMVSASYSDPEGDTMHRDSRVFDNLHYVDDSGRNDIVTMKVAEDSRNVYFYVACADDITDSNDKSWMRLFIDIDRCFLTGWLGYDFILNRVSPVSGEAIMETGGHEWSWTEVGKANFCVKGREMELSIPKKVLGISGKYAHFEFKWADNLQSEGNPMDFLLGGDSAPMGRFNYVYGRTNIR